MSKEVKAVGAVGADIVSRFTRIAGFDPTKPGSVSSEAFKELLAEKVKEREEKAKARGAAMLEEVLKEIEAFDKAKRDFAEVEKKFKKKVEGQMSRIENLLAGREVEETENSEAEEKGE